MSENWTAIAAEVATAIASVGFAATLSRPSIVGPETPWDTTPQGTATDYTVTVIDDGIKDRYIPGTLTTRRVRVLTIGATGIVPVKADRITVRGVTHEIEAVLPLAPGGVDLMFEIELASQ